MAGWIILGVVIVLFLLLIAPIRVILKYDKELFIEARYLLFCYHIMPQTEKKKKRKKQNKSKKKDDKAKQQEEALDQKNLFGIVSWVKIAAESVSPVVKRTLSKGRITRLELYMDVTADNPADAAFEAGRLNAFVYGLYGWVHESFRSVCRPDVQILPNYYAPEGDIFFLAHLHVRLGTAVAAAVRFGIRLLKHMIKRKSQETEVPAQPPPKKAQDPVSN